jgi:hypothetical protein
MAEALREPTRDTATLVFRILLAIAAALCLITTARIEYWNWKAGGAIQHKLEHEPDSKWRNGTYAGEFSFAKAEIRARDGVPEGASLSEAQEAEAQSEAKARVPHTRNRVGTLLREWGVMQYPLALTVMVMSLFMAAREVRGCTFYWWPAAAAATALGFAIYRDYWRALGM